MPMMMNAMKLLVIEDSPLDYEVLLAVLAQQGVQVLPDRVESAAQLRSALKRQAWDLVISDHRLPGFSSSEAFELVHSLADPPPFIIVSGQIGEDAAVEAMRRGVDDYLVKGRLARLGMAARNAVVAAHTRRDKAAAESRLRESETQLRNLSAQLQTRIDEERAAIAREIHDEVGGTLTAVRFDLDILERHVPHDQSQRARRASDALVQAMQATQRIMRNLRPSILDAGLIPALEWQVAQFRERSGVGARFTANVADVDVPAEIAMTLYRACQEALTNITKHAQANQVCVDLHRSPGLLSMEITDNGRGMDPDALGKPDSLGLRGLAERARAVHGQVEISSARGQTSLMLWVPLESPPDDYVETQPS